MKNIFLSLLLSVFLPLISHAQSIPANAVEDAVSFCEKLAFKTDECMAVVSKADFYQKSLVQLCSNLASVESDKMNCIQTIANKYVLVERMVSNCDKSGFWDAEKKCISPLLKHYQAPQPTPSPTPAASATPVPAACDKEKTKQKLETAIAQLKKVKYIDLYESLMDLKYLLRDCGF